MAHAQQDTQRRRLAARVDTMRRDDLIGYALLLAADDWHRIRPGRFVPRDRLLAQTRRHLAPDWPHLAADDGALLAALDGATRAPALLESNGADGSRAACPDGEPVLPPDEPRRAAPLDDLTPLEAVDVANRRRHDGHLPVLAVERAYLRAAGGGDPDAAAYAALGLAELALEQHDVELARRRFAEVMELDHDDASLKARLALAEIAVAEGDLIGAGQYAQEVAETVHADLAAEALELVSELQWELGQWDQALATVRRAVDPADPMRTPSMTLRLARMLVVQGQAGEAMSAYEHLLRHPGLGSGIAVEYVTSALIVGRLERARRELSAVLDPDNARTFCPYAIALAEAYLASGDHEAAARLLERVRAHPGERSPVVGVYAEVLAGRIAAVTEDDVTAVRIFTELADTDDPARRDLVRPLLLAEGMRLRDRGLPCTRPGFRPVLEFMTEAAPAEEAAWAMYSLGLAALQADHLDEAESMLRMVSRYGETDSLAVAQAAIGHVRQLAGDTDGALAHCRQLIAGGSVAAVVESLTVAALVLIHALAEQALRRGGRCTVSAQRGEVRDIALARMDASAGDDVGRIAFAIAVFDSGPRMLGGCDESAAEMFELAGRTGPASLVGPAWLQAGVLREELGQPLRAVAAYEQAGGCGDAGIAGRARLRLGEVARRMGDRDVALDSWSLALDCGSGDVFAESAFHCGMALELSNPDDAEEAYLAVLGEPAAEPALVGRTLARLGALHARHGNRRLAQRLWRRGRRDANPRVTAAFAAERRTLGRVRRLPTD